MKATILAIREDMVVLDGDNLHRARAGDVFVVRGATGVTWARVQLVSAGMFPCGRLLRAHKGLEDRALVGMGCWSE